jgi:hypothetical protein
LSGVCELLNTDPTQAVLGWGQAPNPTGVGGQVGASEESMLLSLGGLSAAHIASIIKNNVNGVPAQIDRHSYAQLYLLAKKPMLVWDHTKFRNKKYHYLLNQRSGVYGWHCLITQKIYIGSAQNLAKRAFSGGGRSPPPEHLTNKKDPMLDYRLLLQNIHLIILYL